MNGGYDVDGNPDPNGQYDAYGNYVGNPGSSGAGATSAGVTSQNNLLSTLADYGLKYFSASQPGGALSPTTAGAAPTPAATKTASANVASAASGVPMWAWIAGAVVLVILFLRK
jgi:hypothetical protein